MFLLIYLLLFKMWPVIWNGGGGRKRPWGGPPPYQNLRTRIESTEMPSIPSGSTGMGCKATMSSCITKGML